MEGLSSTFGAKVFLEQEIDELLASIDVRRNGVINYSDFVTAASNFKEMVTEENLRESFRQFDIDGDGFVHFNELKQILGCTDDQDQELNELIASVDVNNDGMLDFEEFKKMMNIFIKRNSTIELGDLKKQSDPFGINIMLQARCFSKFF